MAGPLHIEKINYRSLYPVLCSLGSCRCLATTPIVTMHPDRVIHHEGLAKAIAGAGFEILPVDNHDGADDDALKERIAALDPERVGEIVIVTSDQDFVPVLRRKVTEGIDVIWVATMNRDPTKGKPNISPNVVELFRGGVFSFIDLARYAGQIETKTGAHRHEAHARDSSKHDLSIVRVTLKNSDPNAHMRLADALVRLREEVKGLTVDVEA